MEPPSPVDPGSMRILPILAIALAACSSVPDADRSLQSPTGTMTGSEPNWKERLAAPYVYVEHRGDYRRLGDAMRALFASAEELGLDASGAPFALFFDDPGTVPTDELRARACLPVSERPARLGQLEYDVLPRAMVAYARVRGAYPEVPRSYPAIFAYLRELGWSPTAPIREVYLVNPVEAASHEELITEVQVPWVAGAR
jgi:AraC family transcriptional regulator